MLDDILWPVCDVLQDRRWWTIRDRHSGCGAEYVLFNCSLETDSLPIFKLLNFSVVVFPYYFFDHDSCNMFQR